MLALNAFCCVCIAPNVYDIAFYSVSLFMHFYVVYKATQTVTLEELIYKKNFRNCVETHFLFFRMERLRASLQVFGTDR